MRDLSILRARELAKHFEENFRQYADQATAEVVAAGPEIRLAEKRSLGSSRDGHGRYDAC